MGLYDADDDNDGWNDNYDGGNFDDNDDKNDQKHANTMAQGQRDPLKSMKLYNVKVISTDIFGTKRATGFWISVHILGYKRATGDPLVSKRPEILGLYRFTKKIRFFGFLDFWISGFLPFFLDFCPYLRK